MTTGVSGAATAVVGAGSTSGCSAAELVQETSAAASAATPHPRRPRRTRSSLADQLSTHQGRGRIVVVDRPPAHTRRCDGEVAGSGLLPVVPACSWSSCCCCVAAAAGTVPQAAAPRRDAGRLGRPVDAAGADLVARQRPHRGVVGRGSRRDRVVSGGRPGPRRPADRRVGVVVAAAAGRRRRDLSRSLCPLPGALRPGWQAQPGLGPRRVRWTWFPDALVPFVDPVTGRPPRAGARYRAAPFPVEAGHDQPVWVDVTVPRDAAPGVYRGTWTVTSNQGRRSGPVTLRVRDFALPMVPASGSRFQIRRPENRVPAVEDLLLRYRVQPGPVARTRETRCASGSDVGGPALVERRRRGPLRGGGAAGGGDGPGCRGLARPCAP